MEKGRYCIYEIMDNGTIKKAYEHEYKTREEAEKSIYKFMHPLDRKKLVAIKVHG